MKLTQILLLGVLGTGLTVSGKSAYGQLDKEYQRSIEVADQCKKDYYPNAQYAIFSKDDNLRILVRNGKVYGVSMHNNGCEIEYRGDLSKTRKICQQGWGCTETQYVFESGNLVRYFKNSLWGLKRKVLIRR